MKIEATLGADAFQGDAHALLTAVYKDLSQPLGIRVEAAKAAIGYEKPRLSSVDGRVESNLSRASIVEEAERKRQERLKAGEPLVIDGEVVGY